MVLRVVMVSHVVVKVLLVSCYGIPCGYGIPDIRMEVEVNLHCTVTVRPSNLNYPGVARVLPAVEQRSISIPILSMLLEAGTSWSPVRSLGTPA